VARSPLKDPEDFLVGQSVVFSTEALMRGRGDILHGRPALVIGFGKLGSSIARLLHAKGVQVTVYDIDPIRRTSKPHIRLSIAAYSYRQYLNLNAKPKPSMNLDEFIDTAAGMDLDAVELTAYYFPETTPRYLARLKGKCTRLGLDISSTAIGNDFCVTDPAKLKCILEDMTRRSGEGLPALLISEASASAVESASLSAILSTLILAACSVGSCDVPWLSRPSRSAPFP